MCHHRRERTTRVGGEEGQDEETEPGAEVETEKTKRPIASVDG